MGHINFLHNTHNIPLLSLPDFKKHAKIFYSPSTSLNLPHKSFFRPTRKDKKPLHSKTSLKTPLITLHIKNLFRI